MNILNISNDDFLNILFACDDYKDALSLLMTCKQLYNNEVYHNLLKKHFTTTKKTDYGCTVHLFNGKYHNENGPAIEWSNGIQEYWFYGKHQHTFEPEYIKRTLNFQYINYPKFTIEPQRYFIDGKVEIIRKSSIVEPKKYSIKTKQIKQKKNSKNKIGKHKKKHR